jgi:anti-anti-sigma factor
MEIETSISENGIKQIHLIGRLDMKGALLIDTQFTALAATKAGGVLVNMSDVEFIASIGMRLLLSNAKALANRGGRMVLCQPQALVKEALQTAGIDTLIPMYETSEEALLSFAA